MFIVLESIDGGGKGRQRLEVSNFFKEKGLNIASMEFPDHSTPVWEKYIHPALHGQRKLTSGGWFCAFSLEKFLWQEELKKYKSDPHNLFLADGYYTTTLVYQCLIQGAPTLDFAVEFAKVFDLVIPDLTIYLDVAAKTALMRKQKEEGKEEIDLFEGDIEVQGKIRDAFKKLIREKVWCPWLELDGNGTIEEVRDAIIAEISPMLKLK